MRMNIELEKRIQNMCNLSENIEERSIRLERLNAIGRMIKANITKEQILSMGYAEAEYVEVENSMCVNP